MMATPRFNSKSPTIKRILREASELSNSPSADYQAAPASDADLFDWHFTIRGPPNSSFGKGIYHGRIVLPPTYPLRPPSFRFLTPSGRFEVNREICLSISGHHEETWQPAWGVRTALVALRAFMETDAKGQLGGLECSVKERERMAEVSSSWRCPSCGKSNGDIMKECGEAAKEKGEEKEVVVPSDLKMGWKDEMKSADSQQKADEKITKNEEDERIEEAELAEGFVRTGNAAADYPAARPVQGVPQPTGTVTARVQPVAQRIQPQTVQRSNDGVPIWIDRMIAAICVLLVAMVLKVLFGM
ncbi:UBC-like protein, partial [Stipitochalara longipes BDJ]